MERQPASWHLHCPRANATQSPTGRPDGIHLSPLGAQCAGFSDTLVVPGGRDPDWGPADPGPAPAGPGPQTPPPATKPAPPQPTTSPLSGPATVTRSVLVRRGVTLSIACAAACRADAVARFDKRIVGRGHGSRRTAGKLTLTVKLSRGGRRALKRARRATVAVTVTVRAKGAAKQTLTRTIAVR